MWRTRTPDPERIRLLNDYRAEHDLTPHVDIPIGYCLDTCHCYVSGFDLSSKSGLQYLVATAAAILGLEHIPVFHTNDAKAAFNSHRDRHAQIGAGYIGFEGFRRILNH